MKTDFFRRKTLALAGVLSAATVLSGIFYAHALTRAIVADVSETFYFLVSEEENVPASAWDAYLGGGAGYVMSRGKTEYAVLSCYFNETDARTVKNNLGNKKISAAVLEESGGMLYFKKRSEKQNAEKIAGCFRTMGSCIRLLYDIANSAETGEYTQQALKRSLSAVRGVLSRLAEENRGGVFTKISACASRSALKLSEIVRGTVYAKDIRYLQVSLSDSYLTLAEEFSI